MMSMISDLPSGKRLHNYAKAPFLIGKSTIPMGHVQQLCQSLPEGKEHMKTSGFDHGKILGLIIKMGTLGVPSRMGCCQDKHGDLIANDDFEWLLYQLCELILPDLFSIKSAKTDSDT